MSTTAPNSRASLLAGLRTGGVRSTSAAMPHTAALGGSFNASRFASQHHHASVYPEEDEDQVLELPSQNHFANVHHGGNRTMPMTAAVDGPNNRFVHQQQQQTRGMNPNSIPFSPGFINAAPQFQAQALQLQMMQVELMKIQAQQYQAELLAQAQAQRQQPVRPQELNKRPSMTFNPPATAGPMSTGFDLRSATLNAQLRRSNQNGLSQAGEDSVPMTAALGGKFGARAPSGPTIPIPSMRFSSDEDAPIPPTPSSTTIISGGTSLGSPASNNVTFSGNGPSKSDSVSSWRRGVNKGNSVLGGRLTLSSPSVKITPPPAERNSPPPSEPIPTPNTASTATPASAAAPKFRPQPLRFSAAVSQPLPVVAVDSSDSADADDSSSNGSSKSNSNSSPTTPRSSSSLEMPLSPREEASKRLYEGLGIGRPSSSISNNGNDTIQVQVPVSALVNRIVSQPVRQPRGPPSAMEELGPKNFATRIRRKAIGGLGMLIGARERREIELVEAY